MKDKLPLVSIIIPVYNGANYLREAITSALAQTYTNIEILVINDGSNDKGETEKIALSYGNKIRYFSKDNGGVSSALNLGIKEMKGEYFSWLSHDDVYLPEKIAVQIDYLSTNRLLEKDVILYSNFNFINQASQITDVAILKHDLLTKKPQYAIIKGAINGITLLIPKRAFIEYGGFNEKLVAVQDYDLWHKMLHTYLPVHLPQILAMTRRHDRQVSVTSPKVMSEGNPFWIKIIRELPKTDKENLEGSEYFFYEEMVAFFRRSPYREALKYCLRRRRETYKDVNIWKNKGAGLKRIVHYRLSSTPPLLFMIKKSYYGIRKIKRFAVDLYIYISKTSSSILGTKSEV